MSDNSRRYKPKVIIIILPLSPCSLTSSHSYPHPLHPNRTKKRNSGKCLTVYLLKLCSIQFYFRINPIQDRYFWGCSQMGGAKRPPSVKSVHIKIKLHISYNHENWHNYTLPCLKKIKKYINHLTHPLVSADMGIFSAEIGNFCYIKKYRYRLHFNT